MDSSPRPPRRFSRWKTTKRTFVLAGVTYKPTDTNTVLQDDNEKFVSGNKTKKDYSDKNDKNKNIVNHSTADSVTKQSLQNSPLVAKLSVARRLCLDTSRRKDSKTDTANSNKTTPTAQETAAVDTVFSDSCPRKEDSVPQSTSSDSTETFDNRVKVDPPLVQDFCLRLERVDLEICEESAHQNKYALSNISQNKSTDAPSQHAPEDKSSAVHTLPSQKKANIAVNNATEGVLEDDVITVEANKRKRQAPDDDKSSDSSNTDKENVVKDSANISVPSQSKKVKKDAALQNMPSATRNITSQDFNVSQKNKNDTPQAAASSARRSGLRNRSLLVSPETLLKNRQYPVFQVAEKKTVSEKNVPKANNVSFVEIGSSVNRKTAKKTLLNELEPLKGKNSSREILNKTPLPVLELTKDISYVNSGSLFSRRSKIKKGSSELEVSMANDTSSGNIGSSLSKKDQSKKIISRIKAVEKNNSVYQKKQNKDSSVNSSRNDLTTPADGASVHTVHSEDGSKRGLRDRRLLPTPEEMQRQRMYPVEFLLPQRRSSKLSESDGYQKSVQNGDSFSQVKQTKPSPAATKEIIKGHSLKNKHKSKKCSPSLQHTSFNSQQIPEPKRRSSGKSDTNSQQRSVQNRDSFSQLEQRELSPAATKEIIKGKSLQNKNLSHESSKSQHKSTKCSPSLQHTSPSSREISEQPTAQRGGFSNVSIEKHGVEDVGLRAKTKIATSYAEKESINLSVHSVQSEDTGSFSSKSRLRDRSLLPTAEEVQQRRLYPVEFLLPKRRSSEKSENYSKQKSVQNRDSLSQVEQTEPTPATTKDNSLKNKNTLHESSETQHKSKKCSPSLQHTSLSSQEISEPKRRSSGKSDKNSIQKSIQNSDSFSQLEQTELSPSSTKETIKGKSLQNKYTAHESSKSQGKSKKCSPHKSKRCLLSLQHASLSYSEISEQSVPQKGSLCNTSIVRHFGAEDIGLRAKTKRALSCVEKEDYTLSVHSVYNEDTFSAKSRLRDQSLLPTAGEGQHHQQYPTKCLLSSSSSVKKSDSDSRQDMSIEKQQEEVQNEEVSLQLERTEMFSVSAKKISRGKSVSSKKDRSFGSLDAESKANASGKTQQKKIVQNRDSYSQLEHTEHSSVPPEIITETSLKSNRKERHPSSQSQPERKKSSSPLQLTSLGYSETFEQLSPQRESTHDVLIEKPVSVEGLGDVAKGTCVEKTNSKHSTLKITKKNGIRMADHETMVQSTLNFSKTVSTTNGAPVLDQRQEPAHKTQKVSGKDSVEGRIKDNRTSILNKKPLSKTDKKQYSLPRRPVKKSSTSSRFEQSGTSVADVDISLEPLQQSITIVDTTWRRPQKLALKKHPVQQKSISNTNDRRPVGQKHTDVRRPNVSVNETLVVPKKVPRKRKLLEELDKAEEGSSAQRINEVESQPVTERLQDGSSGKSSSLSPVDVILQAVRDTEDKLLAETEDDALGQRLVRKVLGRLRKTMKPLISDVEEVNNLKHEIRQKNSSIRKLSAEIKEQQQLKPQLYKEIRSGIGLDQNVELVNVIETMKGYAQLMQALANKSR